MAKFLHLVLTAGVFATALVPLAASAAGAASTTAAPANQQAEAPLVPAEPSMTTASFGDWTLRCVKLASQNARSCEVVQSVMVNGQQAPIAQIALGHIDASAPMQLTVVLPVNVSFSSAPGISLEGGDKTGLSLAWQRCVPGGCFASVPAKDAMIAAWKASEKPGNLIFADATEQKVTIPFSLRGLAQALDALNK